MRKHLVILILFCLPFCAIAQTTDTTFKREWIEINTLITEKKLPKSALIKIDALYKKAKAKNLPMQQMKALLYKFSLEDEVNNKDVNQEVAFWKKELLGTTYLPSKAIIQLMLAKTYCSEYNNNTWKYNRRITTKDYKPTDATTWTKQNFTTTVDSLLQAMLANSKVLQEVKLKELDAILIRGEVKEARPTLFDLLTFEAIDCYTKLSSEEEHESEVDTLAFAKQELFVKNSFKKDSVSCIAQVLQLFQQVILFHKNDIDAIALIDADLQRLVWAKTNLKVDKTTSLYQTALEQLIRKYGKHITVDEVVYLLAKQHQENADDYKPNEDTTNRYENVVALQIIQKRLAEQPKPSYGRNKLLNLQEEILKKHISSKLEAVNVPNQPFRLYVEYKNTDTLFYRVVKLHHQWQFDNDGDTYWYKLAKLPYIVSGFQVLPATYDHQQHAVELKMDALPIGSYMILASSSKNFIDSTDRLFTQFFEVSHLSYIQNGKDYFVLDRETGKPISNVTIQAKTEKWTNGKRVSSILGIAITDKNGFANLKKIIPSSEYNYNLQLIKEKDTLYSNNIYNNNYDYSNIYKSAKQFEQRQAKAFFFLDRSIYRPGQTLYFKALLTTNDSTTGSNKLYTPSKPLTVYLYDVNNKKIDSAKLVANNFGSINGSFKLPLNGLTGGFHLQISGVNQPSYFNVEEYKRPSFFVEINKQASTYKINDSITVTGTVKAYAGNVLNNTKVTYVVNRNTRFIPYWGYGKRSGYGESKQITQGSLTTKDNGTFEFKFKATAAKEVDSSAVFDFSINITATDVNGETREESSKVSVGYKSLLLEAELAEVNESNQLKSIPIITTNLNDNKVSAQVKVSVFPLQTPSLPTRKRYWNAPDQFVLSEADFKQAFPFDAYGEEDDHTKWKQLALLEQGSIQTIKEAAYTFKKPLPQGWYAIELLATDSLGNETKNTVYTQVFDATASSLPAPTNDWERKSKTNARVGDTASILIGSSLQDVFVIANTKRKKGNEQIKSTEEDSYQFFQLNNSKKLWQQTITENDRSGLGLFYAFVKHNRFYQGGSTITVPYDNKQLNIHYATYRNKTEPGSKETWSIQIKGSNKENVAAELVTGMYDASLDQFKTHDWNEPSSWNNNTYFRNNWQQGNGFDDKNSNENYGRSFDLEERDKYSVIAASGEILWNYHPLESTYNNYGSKRKALLHAPASLVHDMNPDIRYNSEPNMSPEVARGSSWKSTSYDFSFGDAPRFNFSTRKIKVNGRNEDGVVDEVFTMSQDEIYVSAEKIKKANSPKIQPRKNFSETAFFFPALYADTAGNYSFSFTMPESLTQWKWLSFAHTKDLAFGSNSISIITQKTLMVQANAPRFMREGDNMEFTAKVSNTSDAEITGQATLELVDATTGNSVDGWFQNSFPVQYFTVPANQSTVVKFPIQVPFNFNKALTWRVVAKAGEVSDGEENTLPVLSNRMLVTETLPLYLKPNEQSKTFLFDKLINNKSESLTNESITVEYTSNPVWSVVQSLPYLMEYPYECAEQTFNRLFANAMAASIVDKHPQIKAQFEKWRKDTMLVKSNLQLNEELKQVLLQETPWVLNAANEQQQQKNIALLFDVVKMSQNIDAIIEKLQQLQTSSGGFAWFKGGNDSRYITNYILTGIGKIKMMQSLTQEQGDKLYPIFSKALAYMDDELSKDYIKLISSKQDLSKPQIGSSEIEYLYMRCFFAAPIKNREAYNYYYNQAKQFWNKQNTYHAAMIALVLHRNNERRFVNVNILPSLLENTVEDTTKGTLYWKDQHTCFWYENPIENQSFMINAINEIATKEGMKDVLQQVDAAKTWLLLNKQTNNWKTTIATADACYAILNTGNNWLANKQQVQIKLGAKIISNQSQNPNNQQETGYIKQRIEGSKVKLEMGNVLVTIKPSNTETFKPSSPSYGAVYWQYFEDLDKITPSATPLSINKQLLIERNTDKGKVLELVTDTSQLKVGDKLIVRMVLKTDREMEYLHLKDMRASGTEPINVLSGYKWQDGLGYYEATKDASTNFFIDKMQKGTYLFEYPLFITHTGTFSVGIATLQCMYAPEFTSHSQSFEIKVR